MAEDGQAVGLQQPLGLQQRASPTAEAPEAGTPEVATGERGAAAAAAAEAGATAATMIEEVRALPLCLECPTCACTLTTRTEVVEYRQYSLWLYLLWLGGRVPAVPAESPVARALAQRRG